MDPTEVFSDETLVCNSYGPQKLYFGSWLLKVSSPDDRETACGRLMKYSFWGMCAFLENSYND